MDNRTEPVRISPAEVKERLDRGEPVFIIDTRNQHDWGAAGEKLPGARRIHYSELERHLGELPHDRLIVTYCT
jgi:rhodanese-related sulfurtransferase